MGAARPPCRFRVPLANIRRFADLGCMHCGCLCSEQKHKSLTVASDYELRNPLYLSDLKRAASSSAVPRRQWRDAIAYAIDRFDRQNGVVLDSEGREWEIPDVDDVFPDDPDQRWFSTWVQTAPKAGRARVHKNTLERVRMIDLYFKIETPDLAHGFGKGD